MIYILENDKLKIKISSMGAELQSICRAEDNTEYLWQGDPTYWAGRATNIFPSCGRMVEGKYTFEGETYELQIHGLVRTQEWSVLRQKANAITLQAQSDEETLKSYPFRYAVEMTYTLEDETLSIATVVHNTDDKTMLFAVGGHPGFNLPLEDGLTFEDYVIDFDETCAARRLSLSDTCFYLNDSVPFPLEDGKRIPLRHDLFDQDAIFLRDTCGAVTLRSDKGRRYVRMVYPQMPFLGLWHKPHTEAPYVCIEPWTGTPALDGHVNDLTEMPEMMTLEPEGTYRNVYTITFG